MALPSQITPFKLTIPPDQASYSVLDTIPSVIYTQLAGGRGRYRRDLFETTKKVHCKWTVGPNIYNYLMACNRVFNTWVQHFLIDLAIDEWGLAEYKAYFIPDTWRDISSTEGLSYVVECDIEVQRNPRDPMDDLNYIDIINAFGPDFEMFLDFLQVIMNIKLPKYMYLGWVPILPIKEQPWQVR